MECPSITAIRYGEFSKRIHAKQGNSRLPLMGSIEVTERCNVHCVHCYINQSAGDQGICDQELSCDQLFKIIDQIVEEGCLWILFTGGEPFLRPDFPDIYLYAKRKGLLITLFTNGTLLTPMIVDLLAQYPPFSIEISLYGFSLETYERVTGVTGSYAQCMRGINLLLQHDLPLKLKTVVMDANQHELGVMKVFAKKLGVEFRYDIELNLRMNGEKTPAAQRLSPEQVVKLDLADTARVKAWQEFSEKFSAVQLPSDKLYQCGAGSGSFHIDANGRLTSCLMVRHPSYNLLAGTFHEGWSNFLPLVQAQKRTKPSACNGCELKALCSWCPGWAQIEHGDQEAPVTYLCQVTRLRSTMLKQINNNMIQHDI